MILAILPIHGFLIPNPGEAKCLSGHVPAEMTWLIQLQDRFRFKLCGTIIECVHNSHIFTNQTEIVCIEFKRKSFVVIEEFVCAETTVCFTPYLKENNTNDSSIVYNAMIARP